MGVCAKRRVVCILLLPYGGVVYGENRCRNPQPTCPRTEGEDYTKCRDICDQPYHAEVDALLRAGDKAKGSTAYLIGHDHACESCMGELIEAGVKTINIRGNTQCLSK